MTILEKIRAEIEQNAYPIVHGVNNQEKGMTLYGILQVLGKYADQEPCDDAVSRQAVLEKAINVPIAKVMTDELLEYCKVIYRKVVFVDDIDKLPSVRPQESKWIPVRDERFPEQHKEVIVTDVETNDSYLSRYIGDGYWECDNGLFKGRIIAWMPKPKPYEQQESEAGDV